MFVYVISEAIDGPCKIGYGYNPSARLNMMQVGNPRKLSVSHKVETQYPRDIERIAHNMAESRRLNGEWFNLTVTEAIEVVTRATEYAKDNLSWEDRPVEEKTNLPARPMKRSRRSRLPTKLDLWPIKRVLKPPSSEFIKRHPGYDNRPGFVWSVTKGWRSAPGSSTS